MSLTATITSYDPQTWLIVNQAGQTWWWYSSLESDTFDVADDGDVFRLDEATGTFLKVG